MEGTLLSHPSAGEDNVVHPGVETDDHRREDVEWALLKDVSGDLWGNIKATRVMLLCLL